MSAGNQFTLLNTLTFSELTDLVRREWIYTKENIVRNAKQLFMLDTIGAGNGSTKRYKEVDVETYADHKAEGANHKKAKVGLGYDIDMTLRTFSKEIEITLEMRTDNRYQEVGSYITSLSEFCENRLDLDLTHRLTFATASSYTDMNGETVTTTVGDGNPLAYATHTLAFSSTTYSNRVSGDPTFSQGAYEAALLLGSTQIYSNFGQKRNMKFNVIFSGDDPTTVREIRQLLESMGDIDAQHAGVKNVYEDSARHVKLPNLATTAAGAYDSTKRRWWGVAAVGQGMNGWQAYYGMSINPTFHVPQKGSNTEDIHNLSWFYVTYTRYGIAIPSPKGLIMSCPTS